MLSMCDKFTRECLEGPLDRSIPAAAVVATLDKAAPVRVFPEHVRCNNGPEFIAEAIKDWCRQTGAQTTVIDAGSPRAEPLLRKLQQPGPR